MKKIRFGLTAFALTGLLTPASEAGPQVRILGAPYTGSASVALTTTAPEAEQHIAVDPGNPATLVAAVSSFAIRGGLNTTKYAFSFQGGVSGSWRESFVPRSADGLPATGDGRSWQANSDPVVAIDRKGNVYLADLYFNDESDTTNGLYVSVANLGAGESFAFTAAATHPVATNLEPGTPQDEDKEWIAVDNGDSRYSGSVYLSWTRFVGDEGHIVFSRSVDQGRTWSAPLRISPADQDGKVQGSQLAVGPRGEVYIVYQADGVFGSGQQLMSVSLDGGETFSAPVAVTPFYNQLAFDSTYRKDSFAAIAVNPLDGEVYILYPDEPGARVGAEVELVRIRLGPDGSLRAEAPRAIGESRAGHQFMPSAAVDANGVLHAAWYDTRNHPGSSRWFDVYAARSFDGGRTFSRDLRVTPTSIPTGKSEFIGDYTGIAAADGYAYPVWTSGGLFHGRFRTARLR